MQHRQITLEDGRYLIFYTFDDETTASTKSGEGADETSAPAERRAEPQAEPQATEEPRRV